MVTQLCVQLSFLLCDQSIESLLNMYKKASISEVQRACFLPVHATVYEFYCSCKGMHGEWFCATCISSHTFLMLVQYYMPMTYLWVVVPLGSTFANRTVG